MSESGDLTICSKWGQAGAYIHAIANVPSGYYENQSTGTISYVLYRYHDYERKYTGNEFHSASRHFYQYADICEVCNKQINTALISIPCSGPPCFMPRNILDR